MQHLDDITPEHLRHVQLPNSTFDHLLKIDGVAITVFAYFQRHTSKYNPTLTKLRKDVGGLGETRLSRAYNVLISEGYLGRVEYTFERPAGNAGTNNPRATYVYTSRVPITEERFAQVVHDYTPGRFVFTPIDTGVRDENGQPVVEHRRVRVLAAEVYCHRGALRIDRDGLLAEHGNARGGRSKAARAKVEQTPEISPSPEPGNPGSGVTRENGASSQVPPEPGSPESGGPGSIKKTNENTKEDQGAPASLRSLGTAQTPPQAPGFTPYVETGSAEQVVTNNGSGEGDPLHAGAGSEAAPPIHAMTRGPEHDSEGREPLYERSSA